MLTLPRTAEPNRRCAMSFRSPENSGEDPLPSISLAYFLGTEFFNFFSDLQ
jgi:hypothetical protein